MKSRMNISFDSDLLESISSEFDLRAPNKKALRSLIFTLDGDYDPEVIQVLNLATGVGKTYLMAAFVEYLRRQGVGNVIIVTPGKTVQAKTIQNFTPGSPRYIRGSIVPPEVVTPQDYSAWIARQNGTDKLSAGYEVPTLAFIFNIQQLIAPKSVEGDTRGSTQEAIRRKPRRFDENAGVLFDYLKELDDLVVIADESHLYGSSAKAFHAALKELNPAAAVGLTASVNKKTDHVIFEYPLYRAIQDRYVKAPVLAFRKSGYGTDEASEEQQLRDARQLRDLKQTHYDAYAKSQNRERVNAVMFVVCSDVEHATQVADLLRTPEYFGNDDAVLQVDSKHEDDITQRRLNELDSPESPVLAVVSVNKLKEGWDVKNIAVVVTLRAMASEVLTQQTMGRGLRLPFGEYTGIDQIDQLDIIAHQSFTELLEAENVLQQFGLEEAMSIPDQRSVEEAIRRVAQQTEVTIAAEAVNLQGNTITDNSVPTIGSELESWIDGEPESGTLSDDGQRSHLDTAFPGQPTVGIRRIPSATKGIESEIQWEPVSIERNPRFAGVTYQFPVTMMEAKRPSIDLSEIPDGSLEDAARRVTSTGDVLHRKAIVAVLGKKLRGEDRESAEVDSIPVQAEDVQEALTKLVIDMPLVPQTTQTVRYVSSFLVPRFVQAAPFKDWTVKSLDSARMELQKLIQNYVNDTLRSTREITTIHPKTMPGSGYLLPFGEKFYEQIDSRAEFKKRRVYGGWFKSLFAEEAFDSYSGEYVLARLLNTSPEIVWWHRLHPQDKAFVFYNVKDRYFPDFVALDTDGVHWIIEGKSEKGRDDQQVQEKRKAAESLVRRLIAEDDYVGQSWGYLIAYEQDTARAESWGDLKAFSQPVSNLL